MSEALTRVEPQAVQLGLPGELSPIGYQLPEGLSYEEWLAVGQSLQLAERAVMWWIGDWLAYGERHYGETYAQAAESTAYAVKTLQNAVYVSSCVESSRRREDLSWSHHAEVASMDPDDQIAWLTVAAEYGWTREDLRDGIRKAKNQPHVSHNSGENEWYTPAEYVEAARNVLGDIDLDPASHELANEVIQATTYYTIEDDGLSQEWHGRVWMNPPYSGDLVGQFCEMLTESYAEGRVTAAVVLVNNATETQWFQGMAKAATAICFPERRVRFWNPKNEESQPLQGQAFVYVGNDERAFRDEFQRFGLVVTVAYA